jgi:hypothetical protein
MEDCDPWYKKRAAGTLAQVHEKPSIDDEGVVDEKGYWAQTRQSLLAALAIPNFMKFEARSKQSAVPGPHLRGEGPGGGLLRLRLRQPALKGEPENLSNDLE